MKVSIQEAAIIAGLMAQQYARLRPMDDILDKVGQDWALTADEAAQALNAAVCFHESHILLCRTCVPSILGEAQFTKLGRRLGLTDADAEKLAREMWSEHV